LALPCSRASATAVRAGGADLAPPSSSFAGRGREGAEDVEEEEEEGGRRGRRAVWGRGEDGRERKEGIKNR